MRKSTDASMFLQKFFLLYISFLSILIKITYLIQNTQANGIQCSYDIYRSNCKTLAKDASHQRILTRKKREKKNSACTCAVQPNGLTECFSFSIFFFFSKFIFFFFFFTYECIQLLRLRIKYNLFSFFFRCWLNQSKILICFHIQFFLFVLFFRSVEPVKQTHFSYVLLKNTTSILQNFKTFLWLWLFANDYVK